MAPPPTVMLGSYPGRIFMPLRPGLQLDASVLSRMVR